MQKSVVRPPSNGPTPGLAQNRRAQARKDLERVIAEDANYPGLTEAMAALDSDISASGTGEAG
jgi:hypothetical protein